MDPESLLSRIEKAVEDADYSQLDAWYERRATLTDAERKALAEAIDRAGHEPYVDAMCGKADLKEAIRFGLETAARTQALRPDDPEYVAREAFYRIERVVAEEERGDPADCERALRLLNAALESDPDQSVWLRDRGRASFERLRLQQSRSAPDYARAFGDFRAVGEQNEWFDALLRLRRDEATRPLFAGLWADFLAFEETSLRNPCAAPGWLEFYCRRWKNHHEWPQCRLPDDLFRELEERLRRVIDAVEPGAATGRHDLNSVGHAILSVAEKTRDRALLEKCLTFYLEALRREPELPLNAVYAANVYRDLARLDGLDRPAGRRGMTLALEAIRGRWRPGERGILELAHCFGDLVLELAPAWALGTDDPLLEEAAGMSLDAIARHGDYYFVCYRSLAAIRLLQGRDDDALETLDRGMSRLGYYLRAEDLRDDASLARLRGQPRFDALLERAGKNPPWETRAPIS